MKFRRKQSGMTLIEVLIASIILFIAIGTVSGVHRILNHYQRINLADYSLLLNQQSFFDYLSYSLNQNITSGSYEAGAYQIIWQSKLNKSAPVMTSYDPEMGAESGYLYSGDLSLYDVTYYLEQYPDKTFELTKLVIKSGQKAAGL